MFPWEPEENIRSPAAGGISISERPSVDTGPLEEQQALLRDEPPLIPKLSF